MKLDPRSELSVLCARVCELSYENFKSRVFRAGMKELGLHNVHTIVNAGVEALAAWNDEMMVINFTGTNSLADFLADISSSKIDFGRRTAIRNTDMDVHTGFFRTLLVVEGDIDEVVTRELGDRKLVICGHSLGGTMAVIYAMHSKPEDVTAVVTFGCPRVGNEEFAEAFNALYADRSLRFVRNNDVVPRVPWKFMGYSHVWRQQYFDRRGRLHEDFAASKVWKVFDALVGRVHRWCRFRFLAGIRDHNMSEYRELIEKAAR